jgi:plastocyanin
MTWGLLLRVAAAKTALVLIGVGLVLRDAEAVAIGVGLAAGVALLSFRSGLLGRLALLALGMDVLAWMATAAVANIAGGEGLAAVVVPLALSIGAAVTVLAAVCDVLRRRGRAMGSHRVVAATAAGSVALFAAGLAVSALGGFGDRVALRPGDVLLEMKAAKFGREHITARGARVGVVVDNEDLFWHTFTIDELGVDLRVPVKARRRADFTAPPGTYTYYCAIPGHRAIGMEGTLTVKSGA